MWSMKHTLRSLLTKHDNHIKWSYTFKNIIAITKKMDEVSVHGTKYKGRAGNKWN